MKLMALPLNQAPEYSKEYNSLQAVVFDLQRRQNRYIIRDSETWRPIATFSRTEGLMEYPLR